MGNYFEQTQFVSNSDLTNLKKLFNLEEERDLSKAYNFGSLVDAMITEEQAVGRFASLHDAEELKRAEMMKKAGLADSTLKLFMETSKLQHEVYRNAFPIHYQGQEITLPMRCKFDFLNKGLKTGADLKTTACTSQKAFVDAIFQFDYDRQAALYMDLMGLERFMFIGLGKKPGRGGKHPVFKYAVIRGDETHQKGKRKYCFLAFNYYFLIYNLNLS